MNVLLLGGGGREHALAWKLLKSPLCAQLVVAPGNPGIPAPAECRAVDILDPVAVVALARALRADLVISGPEAPLVAGVGDALVAAGFLVFGPQAASARIEGSKAFAKEVMAAAGVPTARFEVFTQLAAARARALDWGSVVVKADGLAGGKGVVVADSGAQAAAGVDSLGTLEGGKTLLLEERLFGPELSVMALCDGERFVLLPPAQDHKRIFDGDAGPNTGGMGAYAPADYLSPKELTEVGRAVIAPTLSELARRGSPFRGALYAGLMLTAQGPKVIEFNCRLGDPETQAVLLQLEEDLLPVLHACARGALTPRPLAVYPGASVAVVLAAQGYPERPALGAAIHGLEAPTAPGVERFHAGTKAEGGAVRVAGGRVLTVCARGETVAQAAALAYADAAQLSFEGMQLRRDIAARAPTR